jgi:amino acid transporter
VLSALLGPFRAQPFALPEFSDVESILLLSFYAFFGFEGATMPAGELRQPRRDIARALVTMLVTVTLIYMAVIWAYDAIAPGASGATESRNALAGAAAISLGEIGSLAIVLAAGFSIAANSLSGMVAIPRMAYGMAQEGMLPAWFGRISARWLTPANAILCYGGVAILFSLWGGFTALAAASTLTRLLTYLISAAALPVIERRLGIASTVHRGLALFAILISCWIASHASQLSWLMFAAMIGAGTALYLLEQMISKKNASRK